MPNKKSRIWLGETKTKGDIDEQQLQRQLTFDLQTMLYLVALQHEYEHSSEMEFPAGVPIAGVRYNVVRRPLSGGKGTIVRHKGSKNKPEETKEHYYNRLRQIIDGSGEDAPGPGYFFMRWKTEITPSDITKFRKQCLDPILEQLCDWWDWIEKMKGEPFDVKGHGGIHWRHPFGSINWLDEGGSSDVDAYLETGSETGLRRVDELFTELKE